MIGEDSSQTHSPGVQYRLMTETAQTGMAMYNLNLFSDEDIPEDWKAREDGWEGGCAVDHKKWDMVNFQTVGEVSYTGSAFVCVCYNYDFVASIDEFSGELVDVTFYSSWLGKEEIADHGDIVRHFGNREATCLAAKLEIRVEDADSSLDVKSIGFESLVVNATSRRCKVSCWRLPEIFCLQPHQPRLFKLFEPSKKTVLPT